ncbi:protein FAM234B isoform X2 [Hoplias malabaricus]|uniref:protein FAM234B isoform X2 n=1 Tax=Hoplias malabaricus TaxID=27720 RepID=UPI003462E1B7
MAAALSRALKLPGKKGSQLGEYDPLTQADSDDDSEEDDLVLNYPRNGLGRGSCLGSGATDTRCGRTRLQEEDYLEEEEEDERRDGQGMGKGPRLDGTGGGAGSEQVGDEEGKKAKARGAIRTTAFLLPLACATLTVLLCSFLVPCKQGETQNLPQWEVQLGDTGGVTSPPLTLWDVDGDGMEDLLIAVIKISNSSQQISSQGNNKEYSVVALRGVSGETIWSHSLKETATSLQCGLQIAVPDDSTPQREAPPPVCLLITPSHLTAINASSGKTLWKVPAGKVESQALAVPDLQGDGVPDLLIATLPADKDPDLCLVLHSGMTGSLIGQPVNFTLSAQGKLIGPLLHETAVGAYYILFGLGTVEAVSLRDIYKNATGRTALPASLSIKDPIWEKQRKTNKSNLIHLSSGSEYLLPLVAGVCNNLNNLDPQSNRNVSHSDWVLLSSNSTVSIIRQRDIHTDWAVNSSAIHSRPAVGHFNDDGVPDLLIQQSANGVRKVQIIDGAKGVCLWEAEFVCPRLVLEGSSILTTAGQSVFLFWAGDLLPPSRNVTKVSTPEPVLRRLFLLHPAYPTILQQLMSTTDTALTAIVSYQEVQKDSSYVVVLSRPVSGLGLGAQVVKSLSVKAALTSALTVRLGQDSKSSAPLTPTDFQINKFFRQLSFRQQ